MANRLHNKTVFLTGGGSGIGLSIAQTFLSDGANLFILELNPSNISTSASLLSSQFPSGQFNFIQGDASDKDTVKYAVEECAHNFGGLDIAILNAGILPKQKTVLEVGVEEWESCMRVNALGGPLYMPLCISSTFFLVLITEQHSSV